MELFRRSRNSYSVELPPERLLPRREAQRWCPLTPRVLLVAFGMPRAWPEGMQHEKSIDVNPTDISGCGDSASNREREGAF